MSDSTSENLEVAGDLSQPRNPAARDQLQPDERSVATDPRESVADLDEMDAVDLAGWMSFPASDPPTFSDPDRRPSEKRSQ